jgi:hypothetical protein
MIFEKDNPSLGMMMAKTILDKFFSAYSNIKASDNHKKYYVGKFVLTDTKIKYIDNGKKKNAKIVDIDKDTLSLVIYTRGQGEITVFTPSQVIIPGRIKNYLKKQKTQK